MFWSYFFQALRESLVAFIFYDSILGRRHKGTWIYLKLLEFKLLVPFFILSGL